MPRWLNTRGLPTVAVAICDRCQFKMPYVALEPDPNIPGLMVCYRCRDEFDPYRLPARQPENITLRNPRTEVDISLEAFTYIVDERGWNVVAEPGSPLVT